MKRQSVLVLLVLLVLSGCSLTNAPPPTMVPDETGPFTQQVDAISENLLIALNNRDEAAFLRDMSDDMSKASEGGMDNLYQSIVGKIGQYVPGSKAVVKVDEPEGYRRVFYDATFELEEHVQVLVVYSLDGELPLISGLWFDSPKLRQ